ncbi:PIN domain-containing protein [Sphingobium sp. CCH11-B1]|jgi:predicted nucleic acid-binding protein|uniref:PIN domain-containing protein n=1 Tax=Sphingobium sp. CCH11-B1 TaxID=1768781 RepID=UPI000833F053|nr:PIN domain-containing protein [Sphingobium sp. CCH11-B1]MEA3388784.1 PIN domain-containing protein [Pseudomonadota bacterium]
MFLLDTSILLDLYGSRSRGGEAGAAAWAARTSRDRLFISALTIAELEGMHARAARKGQGVATALRQWIDTQVLPVFDGHVLAIDAAVAGKRGEIMIEGERDALIAATALVHGLTLVTFDKPAFKRARVRSIDPRSDDGEEAIEAPDWRMASRRKPQWLRGLFIRG